MHLLRPSAVLSLAILFATPLLAQRGGGGPGGRNRRSPEIEERVGAWFVTVQPELSAANADPKAKVPSAGEALASLPFVVAAAGSKRRSVVYLADAATDPEKHTQFEQLLFTDEVGVALRFFVCARIDVSAATGAELRARYGKQVPLFVVIDAEDKPVAEVSMAGFKADGKGLVDALDKAVGKANKIALPAFVKEYRDVVRDLELLDAQKQLLDERDKKIASGDKQKRAAIEEDRKKHAAEMQKALAAEKALLAKVDLPPRSDNAERLGGRGGRRPGGGGGRGGRGGGGGDGGPDGGDGGNRGGDRGGN